MALLTSVRIRSWHLIDPDWRGPSVGNTVRTLCGRMVADGDQRHAGGGGLPGDQPTCERCAVIATKRGHWA